MSHWAFKKVVNPHSIQSTNKDAILLSAFKTSAACLRDPPVHNKNIFSQLQRLT